MTILHRFILTALLGLVAGCGLLDTPIKSALKARWAEKPDCSGRGFQLIGTAPKMELHVYSGKAQTDALGLNIFRDTSNSSAVIGLNLMETELLFDASLQDGRLSLSKPHFSSPPSDAFWTMLEELSGESRDKFASELNKSFGFSGFYRCDT